MKRRGGRRFVLNGAGSHAPPSTAEVLRNGSQAEIREALYTLGALIRIGAWSMPPEEREWLGAALEAIGRGDEPHRALGLNTKRKNFREKLARDAAANDLMAQGVAREEAMQIAGRLIYEDGLLRDDPKGAAGESLKKALTPKRLRK